MMDKPKIMLDTNVCEKLRSATHGFEIDRIRTKIASKYSVVVSPRSILELLGGVAGAKTIAHLRADQEKMTILIGNGKAEVLQIPGHFALRTVLGVIPPLELTARKDLVMLVASLLAAKSLEELFGGYVRIPGVPNEIYGFDRTLLADEKRQDDEAHRAWLTFAQEGRDSFGTPMAWAYLFGLGFGVRLNDMQNMFLAERLSAAYEYEKALFNLPARNPQFNVAKHDSDWADFQQLFYLCDPTIHLLTDDAGIRNRCRASEQSKRIILLQEI